MFVNPYQGVDLSACVKTNFHAHAGVCIPGACGILPMGDVLDGYAQAGYGAIAISNHNEYYEPTKQCEGMTQLRAVEYSNHPHMLLIGTDKFHDLPHQQAIDAALSEGAFVILCHPNWIRKEYLPWDMARGLRGYAGLEVINPVIYRLEGSGLASDIWDHLLSQGVLCYGFGNDDFHLWQDLARAYNLIYSGGSDFDSIKQAVYQGRFCASTGLALTKCDLQANLLCVRADYRVVSHTHRLNYRVIGEGGALLLEQDGEGIELLLSDAMPYVRVEVTGEQGAKLFTQPIYQPDRLTPAWAR